VLDNLSGIDGTHCPAEQQKDCQLENGQGDGNAAAHQHSTGVIYPPLSHVGAENALHRATGHNVYLRSARKRGK
jgi:hypothetical protein